MIKIKIIIHYPQSQPSFFLKMLRIFFADAIPPTLEKQPCSAQIMLLMNVVPGYSTGMVIYQDSNWNGQSPDTLNHAWLQVCD